MGFIPPPESISLPLSEKKTMRGIGLGEPAQEGTYYMLRCVVEKKEKPPKTANLELVCDIETASGRSSIAAFNDQNVFLGLRCLWGNLSVLLQ